MANNAGFCFGVERAIKMAFAAARKNPPPLFSLGPLIHNPQVVGQLEQMGVKVVDSLEDVDHGTVILRSHGVPLHEMNVIKERGLKVVDATCPFVKKAQRYASSLSKKGYMVVIVGDKEHPEVQGILSYIEGDRLATESTRDLCVLFGLRKVGIVAQTTQAYQNFQAIVSEAALLTQEVRAFNTICDATSVRQEEAVRLAQKVNCIIIIGGYNSANTSRMADLCRMVQSNTHHVERESELDPAWFRGVQKVGITAGASTPHWLIDRMKETTTKIAPEA